MAFVPEHPASLLGLRIRRWADPGCADLLDPGAPTSTEVISTASFFSAQRAQPGSTLAEACLCCRANRYTCLKKRIIYHAFILWWFWPFSASDPDKADDYSNNVVPDIFNIPHCFSPKATCTYKTNVKLLNIVLCDFQLYNVYFHKQPLWMVRLKNHLHTQICKSKTFPSNPLREADKSCDPGSHRV